MDTIRISRGVILNFRKYIKLGHNISRYFKESIKKLQYFLFRWANKRWVDHCVFLWEEVGGLEYVLVSFFSFWGNSWEYTGIQRWERERIRPEWNWVHFEGKNYKVIEKVWWIFQDCSMMNEGRKKEIEREENSRQTWAQVDGRTQNN